MKYTNKKKLIAVMALIITAASFSGCNSANTAATIDPEVTSSEIVSSVPVSSEVTSSEETSSAPVSSEVEKPESEAASSEATTSSAAEVSSKTEALATSSESVVSSAPATVSQPTASSAPTAVSKPAATSQPVSSAATSAPPAKTVSAPTQQQSSSTKAVEDMTEEELDQWMLEQLEQLNNQPIEVHEYGTDGGTGGNSAESTQPAEGTGDVYEAIRLINEERVKAGLNELEIDDTMMEMAAVRAQETVIKYDHIRPNGSSFGTIFDEFGYNFCSAVENIYGVPDSASKAVSGWMKSPGHKANILDTSITHIGVGYCFDENSSGKHYWVMLGAD